MRRPTVALLGAITHQTLAVWAPSRVPPRSFFSRFRAVPSAAFANAIIILYLVTALLGAVVYLYFKVHIQPDLERDRHWSALGLLELKEDFLAIGLGLLPAYWVCWRRPHIRVVLVDDWRSGILTAARLRNSANLPMASEVN